MVQPVTFERQCRRIEVKNIQARGGGSQRWVDSLLVSLRSEIQFRRHARRTWNIMRPTRAQLSASH
jgi:hypothetical protein